METKSCVICGREVTRDESVAAYMEFSDVDSYVAYAADVDMNDVALWWMETHIPPRNEYADIYPVHIDCTNPRTSNARFSIGDNVTLIWRDGASNFGVVIDARPDAISIRIDDEEYDYELGVDGSWYEINESQDPISITKRGS